MRWPRWSEVEFVEDRNTVRLEVRKILEDLLNQEEKIDQLARHKIESQKRTILEGSQEWDILVPQVLQRRSEETGHVAPVCGRGVGGLTPANRCR